jgi:hypothetical protein
MAINFPDTPSTNDTYLAPNGIQYIYTGVKWRPFKPVESTVGTITASSQLNISAGGSNQSVVITPSGTGNIQLVGPVGIGTNAPYALLDLYSATLSAITVTGDSTTAIVLARASNDASGSALNFRKSRGAISSPLAVNSGDQIAISNYTAYDGSALQVVSQIQGRVETITGLNDVSGILSFYTRPDGVGGALAERMRISGNGNVGIGTSSPDQLMTINSANTTTNSLVSYKQGETTYGYTGLGGDNKMRIQGVGAALEMQTTTAQPITFNVGGTLRMTIDTSGRVTTPFQPAFTAKGLAAQTTYTRNQVVVFNTAPLNIGSGYNTANGRFTAPVAGTYAFAFQIYLNPGNTNAPLAFYKNGTLEIFFLQNAALNGIGLTTIISLAASDYVEVRVRDVAGGTATIFGGGDHTQFTGYLIG